MLACGFGGGVNMKKKAIPRIHVCPFLIRSETGEELKFKLGSKSTGKTFRLQAASKKLHHNNRSARPLGPLHSQRLCGTKGHAIPECFKGRKNTMKIDSRGGKQANVCNFFYNTNIIQCAFCSAHDYCFNIEMTMS